MTLEQYKHLEAARIGHFDFTSKNTPDKNETANGKPESPSTDELIDAATGVYLQSEAHQTEKRGAGPENARLNSWREYYARKQREWRAAHPQWRTRRKQRKQKAATR